MLMAVMISSTSARAVDEDTLKVMAGVCGVAVVVMGGVALGVTGWENAAVKDVRTAGNTYRAIPTQANARRVVEAREKWLEAHEFNGLLGDHWILGAAAAGAGGFCIPVVGMMLE